MSMEVKAAKSGLAKLKLRAQSRRMLMPHVKSQIDVKEENESFDQLEKDIYKEITGRDDKWN